LRFWDSETPLSIFHFLRVFCSSFRSWDGLDHRALSDGILPIFIAEYNSTDFSLSHKTMPIFAFWNTVGEWQSSQVPLPSEYLFNRFNNCMSIQFLVWDRRREGKIIMFDEWDLGNRHLGLLYRPHGSWKVKGNLSNLGTEL
jgi:hypothetical protein